MLSIFCLFALRFSTGPYPFYCNARRISFFALSMPLPTPPTSFSTSELDFSSATMVVAAMLSVFFRRPQCISENRGRLKLETHKPQATKKPHNVRSVFGMFFYPSSPLYNSARANEGSFNGKRARIWCRDRLYVCPVNILNGIGQA